MYTEDPLTSINLILCRFQRSCPFQYSHSSDFISITIEEIYLKKLTEEIKDICDKYRLNIESKDEIEMRNGKIIKTKEITIRK